MEFISKPIQFIKPEGRGSFYRVARSGPHIFIVVFDEDDDQRIKDYIEQVEADYVVAPWEWDFIGERKGGVTIIENSIQNDKTDAYYLEVAQSRLSDGDVWSADVYQGLTDEAMRMLFYPLTNMSSARQQLLAALATARGVAYVNE